MREKDEEMIGLRERIKRTEIEMKAALERYEELKNQDTRSRGYMNASTVIFRLDLCISQTQSWSWNSKGSTKNMRI